ncbi:MAG: hypothetical protein J6K72_08390 [Clostridia bacterium]|nr:hypothetical protein [Clostridia bacterium]
MAEIGSWNGHRFVVTPTLIQSFSDLSIKGSSETEEKTGNGEKYVSRKNGKPYEVGMTVELNAYLGCKVKEEAMKLVEEAGRGESSYFYLGGEKLLPCQLMLVEAGIEDVAMSTLGQWISCNVQLKMKQCTKGDNTPAISTSGKKSGGDTNWWDKVTNAAQKSISTSGLTTSAVSKLTNTLFGSGASVTNAAEKKNATGTTFLNRVQQVSSLQSTGRKNTNINSRKTPKTSK